MKRELNIIVDELRRLKEEGVQVINVSEEALVRLRERAGVRAGPSTAPPVRRVKGTDVSAASRELAATLRESGSTPTPAASPKASGQKLPAPPKVVLPEGDKQVKWEALREQVLACPTCNGQVKPDRKVVFGVGNLDAEIFFIGEAPGADEEIEGEPFVGKAGELLTRMIGAMGLERGDVYIGNIMNWRPAMPTETGNRAPTPEEMAFCLPYLLAQIEIVQPKVLVALGNTAISGLFGADPARKMKDVRGKWKDFQGTPVMMTYHPAYLVRNPARSVKRAVWEDLLQVMEKVGLPITEKQRRFFAPKNG